MATREISDLARFHQDHRPGLMAFFLRRVRNYAEAEDLTQEVFLRLAQRPDAAFRSVDAYLFQIAANLLRDEVRRRKIRDEYLSGLKAAESADIEHLDPQRIFAGREALLHLASALKALPDRTRDIFLLFRYENLDHQAIADSFGISTSAVEKHIYRAMAKLMASRGERK